jgi:hypothetical protein
VRTGRLSRTRRQDDVSYWGGTSKSLTPESVRANAHMATVMIAEKTADEIRREAKAG